MGDRDRGKQPKIMTVRTFRTIIAVMAPIQLKAKEHSVTLALVTCCMPMLSFVFQSQLNVGLYMYMPIIHGERTERDMEREENERADKLAEGVSKG